MCASHSSCLGFRTPSLFVSISHNTQPNFSFPHFNSQLTTDKFHDFSFTKSQYHSSKAYTDDESSSRTYLKATPHAGLPMQRETVLVPVCAIRRWFRSNSTTKNRIMSRSALRRGLHDL